MEQTTLFGESYVYGCIKSGEEHGFAPLNAKNPRGAGCWGDPGNGVQIGWFLWGEALARKAVGLPAVEPQPDALTSSVRTKSDDESTAGPLGLWMPWQGTVFADARAGVPEGAPLYSAFRFGVVGMFGKDEGFADIGADLEFHCTTLANRTERIWGIVGPQGGGSTLNNPNDTNMSSISPRPFGMIQAAARYVFSRAFVLTLKLPTTV